VDEDLDFDVGRLTDLGDLGGGELARQDNSRGPDLFGELDRAAVGARHLRRRVDRQARRHPSNELGYAEILHDDCVDAGRGARAHRGFHVRELLVEHQRVERHVPANAALVQIVHRRRELARIEVRSTRPGVEALEPEVDRVGPRAHRRLESFAITSRCENFRAIHGVTVVAPERTKATRTC
jgi:hypothetical protein